LTTKEYALIENIYQEYTELGENINKKPLSGSQTRKGPF
jgi:hypothetical protein